MTLPGLVTKVGIATGIALLSSLPFSGPVVRAQESPRQGVTVSPSLRELVIGPGLLEAKTTVTVTNNTNSDLDALLKLVDFNALNEFGGVSFGESGKPLSQHSLLEWMSLPGGGTLRLPAGKDVTVPVTVKNDERLSPGGHYGAVIVSVSGGKPYQSSSEVTFNQEVASLLFVKKIGGETYGVQLETLTPHGIPSIPKRVDMKFKGTGNVHVAPRGYIEVKNPHGKLVAKGIINPESTLVLPNKSRHFTTIIQTVEEPEASGNYTLTAYYRHDETQEFQTETITFRRGYDLLSTNIILPVTLVLTGATILLYFRKKHHTPKKR